MRRKTIFAIVLVLMLFVATALPALAYPPIMSCSIQKTGAISVRIKGSTIENTPETSFIHTRVELLKWNGSGWSVYTIRVVYKWGPGDASVNNIVTDLPAGTYATYCEHDVLYYGGGEWNGTTGSSGGVNLP